MADREDVHRIALALPGPSEGEDHFAFSVLNKGKQKGFVWAWNERVAPKKARVPHAGVVAVRVADQHEKEALLASGEEKFFTEPHYNGFPAVLVRLPLIDVAELEELIADAWRCQASRALAGAWERDVGRTRANAPAPCLIGARETGISRPTFPLPEADREAVLASPDRSPGDLHGVLAVPAETGPRRRSGRSRPPG